MQCSRRRIGLRFIRVPNKALALIGWLFVSCSMIVFYL